MFKQPAKGFTLLELLVVIVLLGIVSSFAVLSLNITGLETELTEETKKIQALIKLAKEEAIIQAQEIVLEIEKQTYVFKYWDWQTEAWLPKKDKVFRQRKIHDGLKIYFETDGSGLFLKNKDDEDDDKKYNRIFFSSSGEQAEFKIKIFIKEDEQLYYHIKGELNGDVVAEKNPDF